MYRSSDIYVYDYPYLYGWPDPSAYEAPEEDPAAMVETPFRAWVLRTPIGIPHDMGEQ
jgi:hypothetical protein